MKKSLLKTPIGRFRLIAILEGISFLVLLGIAMPLKYIFALPLAVRVVGSLHGLLFVLFMFALMQITILLKWSPLKVAAAFAASLIPFGTFVFDAKIKNEH